MKTQNKDQGGAIKRLEEKVDALVRAAKDEKEKADAEREKILRWEVASKAVEGLPSFYLHSF